jgi:hypothetical protein
LDQAKKDSLIRILEIVKYLPFLILLIPLFAYFNALTLLINYRDDLSFNLFISFFGFNTFFFLILFITGFVGSILMFKSIKHLIKTLKEIRTWESYSKISLGFLPFIFFYGYMHLFLSSIMFIDYFVFMNERSLPFAVFNLLLAVFAICLYLILSLKGEKYRNYEYLDLGKVDYNQVIDYIENILNKSKIKYRKLGPRKGFSIQANEIYLIKNKLEIMINCPFKDKKPPFFLKDVGKTFIYIGEVNKDNIHLVRKLQNEINKLKKNE